MQLRDSRRTPATAAVIRPAHRPVTLTRDQLRLLAKLEGRPLPRGQELAELLGVPSITAWRLVRMFRQVGALRFVSMIRLPPEMCECVTYLKVSWADAGGLEALDAWILADEAITVAVRITGAYDYRLSSRHADFRSASDWSRSLLLRPKVDKAVTQFCTVISDRPNYAAAILAADAG